MPFYLQDGTLGLLGQQKFASTVDSELPDYYEEIIQIESIHLLSALFRDFCFLSISYLVEDCHHNYLNNNRKYGPAKKLLPKKLARPWAYLASRNGAQPWLDYSRSHILNNYYLKDPSKGYTEDNLGIIRLFVGIPGEIGFSMTHLMVSARSPALISSINKMVELIKIGDAREKVNEQLDLL